MSILESLRSDTSALTSFRWLAKAWRKANVTMLIASQLTPAANAVTMIDDIIAAMISMILLLEHF
ncbi:MAG TPA: hypothetical protein VLM38_14720 [Blastocatellia bacterium]|nr:hypothetical protein [Blastocatellia bacterium]